MTSARDVKIFNEFLGSVEIGQQFTTQDIIEYALNRRLQAPLKGTLSRLMSTDDRVIKIDKGRGYGAPPIYQVIA